MKKIELNGCGKMEIKTDKKLWKDKIELYRGEVAIALFGAMITCWILGFLLGYGL